MSRWNQAPLPRDQLLLIPLTLDERIPQDHPVRLFGEILDGLDWWRWEQHYCLVAGQPPIHPKIVAGALLYGLTHGIRSSRRLEWACAHAVDFLWLVEGRRIDHSTFCEFRTGFHQELKDVFRQIGRVAMNLGLLRLNQVALDGTRVKANSSAHATASAKTLEERLAGLDEQIERLLAEAEEADRHERDLFGESLSATNLPAELKDVQKRQAQLRKALQAAQAADAGRKPEANGSRRSAKVPVADPEAVVLPNKGGGYAPNYTPVATVDGACGLIADADVLSHQAEAEAVLPAVERIEAAFGQKPEQFLADSAFATGDNLSSLAERGIEALMPVEATRLPQENPAERADPQVPVAEAAWSKLPRRPQSGKLDRAAFVYDAAQDVYWCPQGRALAFTVFQRKDRQTCTASEYRIYRCASCEGCRLAGDCLAGKSVRRMVSRDQHESVREAVAARLKTEVGRKAYGRRAWLAETPNAVLKQVMGLRQFLLRGLEKVRTEWFWACTAFNLKKLIAAVGRLRAGGQVCPA